ncbi:MAG: hypothetical protein KAH10_00480 [Flavobacteriales bacterium]|nr:hypothetical protein [Flavobacteriales bacterium]
MKRIFSIAVFLLAIFAYQNESEACTTAVISGKYTKDGRPMLWKNRDTWAVNNVLMYFDDAKYPYLGLVNSKDREGKSIWMGMNSTGFAIMNSASYNLNLHNDEKLTGYEGRAMRDALASCRTLGDFEAFLDALGKVSGLEANFGVIDAEGGAAYYEIGNEGYVKFDANDPTVAPFGYIIRANYSFTGDFGKESSGYIRYNTVNEIFYHKSSTVGLTPKDIEQTVTKGLTNSLTKRNLFEIYGDIPENTPKYEILQDYIPRTGSASSVVVQGIMKGENPNLATMWSNVGFPLASIMVPTWINGSVDLPYVVKYNEEVKDSPVCFAALKLKKEKILNIRWGKFASKYINVNALYNRDGSGITQIVNKKEDEIYKKATEMQTQWRLDGASNKKDIKTFYDWIDKLVIETYKEEFDIDISKDGLHKYEMIEEGKNSMKGIN